MVQELLAEARLRLSELDGIAFGAGPGSFTGLRIACGVAQGLALGAGLKVVGVSTLEAMAEIARLRRGSTRVVAALDARMQEVYLGAYEYDGTRWHEVIEASAVRPDAAPLPPGESWVGVGAGFAAYPALSARLGGSLAARDDDVAPSAAAIGALALPRFAANEAAAPRDAAPLYVRQRVALTAAERAAGLRL